jgi:hypothetical protein
MEREVPRVVPLLAAYSTLPMLHRLQLGHLLLQLGNLLVLDFSTGMRRNHGIDHHVHIRLHFNKVLTETADVRGDLVLGFARQGGRVRRRRRSRRSIVICLYFTRASSLSGLTRVEDVQSS